LTGAFATASRPEAFPAQDLERYRQAWARPGALKAMINWYRALFRLAPGAAPDIRLPVRIIWGDQDMAAVPALADQSAALCRNAEIYHLPEASHWVQHDEPEAVNGLILQFLDTVYRPASAV
jgi:pimeloyl-ACP methyl ester carboxylesterase